MELGEPYRDNHCRLLEGEIDAVTGEVEAAAKNLRELSAVRDKLFPELEQLKVGPMTTRVLKLRERSKIVRYVVLELEKSNLGRACDYTTIELGEE